VDIGARAEMTFEVEREDTAQRVGSGDVLVLATPRLIAMAEAVTFRAMRLPEGQTSLGVRVSMEHLAASPVGMSLTVRAEVTAMEGWRVTFTIDVIDRHGTTVGHGTIERVVVDRALFLERVPRP
jgi:predicted thioesterase